jgi:hypothetical protein
MNLDHRIEEATQRVFMTLGEGASGAAASRYICALVAARPELAGWDWIQDVRESDGKVDNADIEVVARAFGRSGPCWTVFVSHDANLSLWCRVMDGLFAGRRHLTALTPEAAVKLLDEARAALAAAVS